jgi:hypothetical protein
MGGCLSSLAEKSDEDIVLHREVEKPLKEVRTVNNCSFSKLS